MQTVTAEHALAVTTQVQIPGDGEVLLRWQASGSPSSLCVLIIRSGAVPAYTSIGLTAQNTCYHLRNLSRHQRYMVAVAALGGGQVALSTWTSVTPRAGLHALCSDDGNALTPHLAHVTSLSAMPQDRRLTAYWKLSRGFVDGVVVSLHSAGRCLHRFELEPEVVSLSLDQGRGVALRNGVDYELRVHSRFAGVDVPGPEAVTCTPAAQGEERQANRKHPQANLFFPFLSIDAELKVFDDDGSDEATAPAPLLCQHCRKPVSWERYELRCVGCGAEYIPNSLGSVLEVRRLRFGTCACCLPRSILIQKRGSTSLTCAQSGKEHIRTGSAGFSLIEDLPHGLCQCCRPRRPLQRKSGKVTCSKTGEPHSNQDGRYVLAPTQPVFDAAAIDALLDQGLAEICSTGVTRGRR
ncbi:MAG: hypothetical protein ABIJ09_04215 [Pseudomonadota bacterium]